MLTKVDIKQLITQPESEILDFKAQAALGRSDHERGELLRDLLAFGNTRRHQTAHILLGVEQSKEGSARIAGLTCHIDDATFQDLVGRVVCRSLKFIYYEVDVDGLLVGVLAIEAEQPRPLYLRNDYGKTREKTVYVRRGSKTAILTPEDALGLRPVLDHRRDRSVRMDNEHLQGLVRRWLEIFDAHGVNRHQIPILLTGFSIPVSALDDWRDIADLLTEDVRNATCELFNVRREWLDGDEDRIYCLHYLGNNFIDELIAFKQRDNDAAIIAFKSGKKELCKSYYQYGALLLEAEIHRFGEKRICRYSPICMPWQWSYYKHRIAAKEALYTAHLLQFEFWGFTRSSKDLAALRDGTVFPATVLARVVAGQWYPDDYVLLRDESCAAKDAEETVQIRRGMHGQMAQIEEARKMFTLREPLKRPTVEEMKARTQSSAAP